MSDETNSERGETTEVEVPRLNELLNEGVISLDS